MKHQFDLSLLDNSRKNITIFLIIDIVLFSIQLYFNSQLSKFWFIDTIISIISGVFIYFLSLILIAAFANKSRTPVIYLYYLFPHTMYYFLPFVATVLSIPLSGRYSLLIFSTVFLTLTLYHTNLIYLPREVTTTMVMQNNGFSLEYTHELFIFPKQRFEIESPFQFFHLQLVGLDKDILANKIILEDENRNNDSKGHYLYLIVNGLDIYNNSFAVQIGANLTQQEILDVTDKLRFYGEINRITPPEQVRENGSGIIAF